MIDDSNFRLAGRLTVPGDDRLLNGSSECHGKAEICNRLQYFFLFILNLAFMPRNNIIVLQPIRLINNTKDIKAEIWNPRDNLNHEHTQGHYDL